MKTITIDGVEYAPITSLAKPNEKGLKTSSIFLHK
jgi:hypothetical protein